MNNYIVRFDSPKEVRDFVDSISVVDCDITASANNQIVNAKSFLELMTIFTNDIEINADTDNEEWITYIKNMCKRYN